MKLRLPWFRKPAQTPELARDLSTPLYQALIDIRDQPKHARKKAKQALSGPRPFRHLYRALVEIKANPDRAHELAAAAISDAQSASRLHAALKEIAEKPKEATLLAAHAILVAARHGALKS